MPLLLFSGLSACFLSKKQLNQLKISSSVTFHARKIAASHRFIGEVVICYFRIAKLKKIIRQSFLERSL